MSYWRLLRFGNGPLAPFAVGTVIFDTQLVLPPTDGMPYLTDEEMKAAIKIDRDNRQGPTRPWQSHV